MELPGVYSLPSNPFTPSTSSIEDFVIRVFVFEAR